MTSETTEAEYPAPSSGRDVLARVRAASRGSGRKRRESVLLCLNPNLLDEWEEKTEQLEAIAPQANGGSGGGTSARLATAASKVAKKLATEVQALEADIEASQVRFWLETMNKDDWQTLCDSNPPRDDQQIDHLVGYNRVAVVDAAIRDCMVDPVFEDCTIDGCEHAECGSWQNFVQDCNPSEWEELRRVANAVNKAVALESPKSALASRILARRGRGSGRPADGE